MLIRASLLLAVGSSVGALLTPHPLLAATGAPIVNCSPKVKLQKKIDTAKVGMTTTINVSGTCNENLVVPAGKTIIINAASPTAAIVAANSSLPALVSKGDTTLQKMNISNGSGAAEYLVGAARGGQLDIISSDLNAPNVGSVVAAYVGSVRVENSRVVGGQNSAIEVAANSNLVLKGNPSLPTGPTGSFEAYIRSTGAGVDCGKGTVRISAGSTGSSTGAVLIEHSDVGLSMTSCDFDIGGSTDVYTSVKIQNNNSGIRSHLSRGQISTASIIGNTNYGIRSENSEIDIQGSSVSNNGVGISGKLSRIAIDHSVISNANGDIENGVRSSVYFYNVTGPSSMPKAPTWEDSVTCRYSDGVTIDTDALVETLNGPLYIDNPYSCVFQEGVTQ